MSPAQHPSSVLDALRSAGDAYVSGEALAARYGVSRAAVWKQVRALRKQGYEVDARPHQGYRLLAAPDLVLPGPLEAALTTRAFGRSYHHALHAATTMELARTAALDGAPEGHVALAEEQRSGRGRLQRAYASPPGGLWFSLVLRPPVVPAQAPPLALLTAVGVAEGIREATGLQTELKWPNDLRINGRKLVGILLEMDAEVDAIHFLIVGVGVNVNLGVERLPSDVRAIATTLRAELGRPVDRVALLSRILACLERRYDQFLAHGIAPALAAWRAMPNMLGQPVVVKGASGDNLAGVAEALDDDGALLLRLASGQRHRVVAGDVIPRPADAS